MHTFMHSRRMSLLKTALSVVRMVIPSVNKVSLCIQAYSNYNHKYLVMLNITIVCLDLDANDAKASQRVQTKNKSTGEVIMERGNCPRMLSPLYMTTK